MYERNVMRLVSLSPPQATKQFLWEFKTVFSPFNLVLTSESSSKSVYVFLSFLT